METFGMFITAKRKEKEISLRQFAKLVGISPVHTSNIERGERAAPPFDTLNRMAEVLSLSQSEQYYMYDLAAQTRSGVSIAQDLVVYIFENPYIVDVLRSAKLQNATTEDWEIFINHLSNKRLDK